MLLKLVWILCKCDVFLFTHFCIFAVPFYDGRLHQLEVPNELRNIPDVLPRYAGDVPEYSLALVAYTVSTYCASSGQRRDQVTANLNIHYGVVLHEPLMEPASANEENEEDEGNE